jgi:hypothetical protein
VTSRDNQRRDDQQSVERLLGAARAYAAAGIPIFPCVPNEKRPATRHGFHDATTDKAQIIEWWRRMPEANIATEPEASGHAVIDADPGSDIDRLGLPVTRTHRSPRGRHFIFRGSLPSTSGRLGEHIDTRGVGGYLILPPSIVNGREYRIINLLAPQPLPQRIAELLEAGTWTAPRPLLGTLAALANTSDIERDVLGDDEIAGRLADGSGDRSAACYGLIQSLRVRGYGPAEIGRVFLHHAGAPAVGHYHQHPAGFKRALALDIKRAFTTRPPPSTFEALGSTTLREIAQ